MQTASGRGCEEKGALVQGDDAPPSEARKCSWQDATFVASLLVQLAVIGVSIGVLVEVAAREDRGIRQPEVLQTILTLETVVQCIEFAWYLVIGLTYYFWHWSWGVEWRYFDWMFSTPVMLITLFFFVQYLHAPEECMTNEQLSGQSGFALAIVSIIVFDWAMLLFGLSIELKEDNTKDWPCLRFLRYFRRNRIHNVAIALGFLALLLAFWPHFVWAADGYGSDWGWVAIFVTLAIWAVYGVVAWWLYDDDEAQRCPATSNERARNACYNVLDIFSKNLAGVLISYVALRWDGETLVCAGSS